MAQTSSGRAAPSEPPPALRNPKIGCLQVGGGPRGASLAGTPGEPRAAPESPSSAPRGDSSEPSPAAQTSQKPLAATPLLLQRGCCCCWPKSPPVASVACSGVMLLEFQPNHQIPTAPVVLI